MKTAIINDKSMYEDGFSVFQLYNPIKVANELKDDFNRKLSTHFANNGIEKWSSTQTPLKNCWKFQRIN